VFQALQADAARTLPREHSNLGELVCIDGSLIDAVVSINFKKQKKNHVYAKT
jgi:hypothetical protein